MLLPFIIDLYSLVVLGAVIISWIRLPPQHPVAKILNGLTEPLLSPIRKIIPPFSGIDFSPMVLLILLILLRRIVI